MRTDRLSVGLRRRLSVTLAASTWWLSIGTAGRLARSYRKRDRIAPGRYPMTQLSSFNILTSTIRWTRDRGWWRSWDTREHGWRAASNDATAKALSALYQNTSPSEERYRGIFQKARVALWDEDFSPVLEMLDRLRAEGVRDLRSYFHEHPKLLIDAIDLVRLNDVNEYTLKLFEAERKDDLLRSLASVFVPESEAIFLEELSHIVGRPPEL